MGGENCLPGPLPGGGGALPDHAESSHLSADRRDRRCGYDVLTGTVGWFQELGLSLLLAARCDIHFALFMFGGYFQEAKAWQQWLLRAIAGSPDQVQIMYGIAGQRYLPEREISWLTGYENSKPVRIGNAASEQLQLDIYGEVMAAFHHAMSRMGKDGEHSFAMLRAMVEHLETIWQEPDEGIWETRGGRQNFTYSKVMAWVAFDRAIKAAGMLHADAPVERWQKVRAKIHDEVCSQATTKSWAALFRATAPSIWMHPCCLCR